MSTTTIGTCSICGGRVSVPTIYFSVVPPTPTCENCGATALPSGPVIPMRGRSFDFTTVTFTEPISPEDILAAAKKLKHGSWKKPKRKKKGQP